MPSSQTSIAGSTVNARSRSWKDPSAFARSVAFWSSISCWSLTLSLLVANQSCQISVIRSTSCWSDRTMRSSHQQWSWPQASAGASALPSSSAGSGPFSVTVPPG